MERKKKRVCVVSPLYHPSLGGLGRQAKLLTERLAEEGVEVFVIARNMKGMPTARFSPHVKVHRAWAVRPYLHNFEKIGLTNVMVSLTFSVGCTLLLISTRKEYDVVHFHGASLPLFINLPVLKLLGKKVIAKVASAKLGIEAGSLRGRYFGLGTTASRILKTVDAFIATTEEIRDGLLNDGILSEKIRMVPNFIDIDPIPYDRSDVRQGMNVIFSGRFIDRKGIDHLFRAWKIVMEMYPAALLILLGDGPLLEKMKRLSPELGIDANVKFIGHVSDVESYLMRADIFVLPSLQEGMPNALLEAMACGLPVVATAIGGVEDVINDGVNGILVKPADPGALADGLLKLLGDKEMARQLGKEARNTIQKRFSLDSVVPEYKKLYKELLGH